MEKRRTRLFQQALSILLCVAMMLPMVAVPGYATEVTEPVASETAVPEETRDVTLFATKASSSGTFSVTGESALNVDKTIAVTEDPNKFVLTLDAYATGDEITTEVSTQIPLDVILVLDASSSMLQFSNPVSSYHAAKVDVSYSETSFDYSGGTYPANATAETNLTTVFTQRKKLYDPDKGYFAESSNASRSYVIPVKPGDEIYCSSFASKQENGHMNGIRVTYFKEDGTLLKSLGPTAVYNEFTRNDSAFILVPEDAYTMNVSLWNSDTKAVIKNRSLVDKYRPSTDAEFNSVRAKILQEQIQKFADTLAENAKETGVTHKLAIVTFGGGDVGSAGDRSHQGLFNKHVGVNGFNDYYFTNTGLFVDGAFKNYMDKDYPGVGSLPFYTPVFRSQVDTSRTYYYLRADLSAKTDSEGNNLGLSVNDGEFRALSYNSTEEKWKDIYGNNLYSRKTPYDLNTRTLFYTMEEVVPSRLTTSDYKNALTSIVDENGNFNPDLQFAINRYVARGTTNTKYGLAMANNILNQNQPRTYTDALGQTHTGNQVVILFTDGNTNNPNTVNGVPTYSTIFDRANNIKDKGATLYTVSVSEEADVLWMDQISSNCDLEAYDSTREKTNGEYYINTDHMSQLEEIFQTIAGNLTTSSTSVTLDETAVLKEVLSDYVQLDEDADVKYKVYTQAYMGKNDSGEDIWGDLEEFDAAKVVLSPTTGRVETIEVSGFDYAEEYVSVVPRNNPHNSEDGNYHGRRLVLKVFIETREGFWGGNNVPANKVNTAIYFEGKVVKPFPMPEANVPINVTVDAEDKTIYYGGEIDTDNDGAEGDDLIAKVTIGGKEVTVNNDGTFTPSADWMDDFANAKWDNGSTKPDFDLSNTEPGDYSYTVVVTPNSDGTKNESKNPSNIAGNVDGGEIRPEDLTESAEKATDKGHIYVLVPELTFRDSTTQFGTSAEGYDFNREDFVSTETVWKDMENGREAGNDIPAVDAGVTEPELTLTYTPNAEGDNGLEDGYFVTDTKVNVDVAIGDKPITDLTTFHWQDCDHDVADIESHKGTVDSNEFWVHVTLNIVPDTVAIDFGLDVVIDVLANDPQTENLKPELNGIAKNESEAAFGSTDVAGTYGKLSVDTEQTDKVRYSLNTGNGMQIKEEEVFKYQAKYTVKEKETLLDSTVTVIPATTIYYEDSFVTFEVLDYAKATPIEGATWEIADEEIDATQAEDRPGRLTENDANYIYGYDAAYTNMTRYSLGSARMVNVQTVYKSSNMRAIGGQYATAKFAFWGTGFDVISLTSAKTGTIVVGVQGVSDAVKTVSKNYVVDTYYGYKYENGKWVVNTDDNQTNGNDLYQIPVMKVEDLPYGKYDVTITASHAALFDHKQYGAVEDKEKGTITMNYDFYLDAIRIYDPANDGAGNSVIENAYKADGEGWPEYFELRDLLISANTFNSLGADDSIPGIIFIDGNATLDSGTGSGVTGEVTDNLKDNTKPGVADYANYGPNNELYLAPGQAVAFNLNIPTDNLAQIHLALKGVNGPVSAWVYDANDVDKSNKVPATINTATDLYYDVTGLNGKTVVIKNNGSANILSITNFKVTYQSAPSGEEIEKDFFKTTEKGVKLALRSLGAPVVEEPEETVPETTAPEETVPETTVPETTVPEETTPETTVPEETVPETTVPETTVPAEPEVPETFEPQKFNVQLSASSVKVGSNVIVTVTTGRDVDHITVNGEAVTKYTGSLWSKTRTWQVKVKAETAGAQAVEVICYNAEDLASAPVVKTVTVTQQYTSVTNWLTDVVTGIVSSLLSKWR